MNAIKVAHDPAHHAAGGKHSGGGRHGKHDLRLHLLKAITLLVALLVLAYVSVSDGNPVSSGSDPDFPAIKTIVDADAHPLFPNRQ